jgi:hypothetical protein
MNSCNTICTNTSDNTSTAIFNGFLFDRAVFIVSTSNQFKKNQRYTEASNQGNITILYIKAEL